jgi:hypothetical protein
VRTGSGIAISTCSARNVGDGILTAHPRLRGTKIETISDTDGKALGEEMMRVATNGWGVRGRLSEAT